MITDLGSIPILVNDAEKALRWYHEKLGFEIVNDKGHWIAARPKNSLTVLHLCGKCSSWGADTPGGQTGIWFKCGESVQFNDESTGAVIPRSQQENVEDTYLELKGRGVEFSTELRDSPLGKYAVLKDLDGNEFYIW